MSERTITSIAVEKQASAGDLVLVFEDSALPEKQCLEREAEARAIEAGTGARVCVVRLEDPRIVVLRRFDLWRMGLDIVRRERMGRR